MNAETIAIWTLAGLALVANLVLAASLTDAWVRSRIRRRRTLDRLRGSV